MTNNSSREQAHALSHVTGGKILLSNPLADKGNIGGKVLARRTPTSNPILEITTRINLLKMFF